MDPAQDSPRIPRQLGKAANHKPSNLIPALLLLESGRRNDALLFGAWCRHVDDIADDPSLDPGAKRAALQSWMRALDREHEADLPEDFLGMLRRRNPDRELLREILRGMMMDVPDSGKARFATFPELELYCRRVASAVGIVSAGIFGTTDTAARIYAERLGIALQLTNILRDVSEDAAMNRIYIPLEDFHRFGVAEEELLAGSRTPEMTHLLNHQAERADSWFAKAELAWSELTVNQRRLMRPARLMSGVYRELLLAMHRDRCDVFAKRYGVPAARKFLILVRVMLGR